MLDLPHVVDAERVRELDLLERVLDQLLLAVRLPRARELVLVEDAELHATAPSAGRQSPRAWNSSRSSSARAGCRRARARPRRVRPAGSARAPRRATREHAVPEVTDHVGPGERSARLADERAVAHLGQRGRQVLDVRRLVLADVRHEAGRLAVAGHELGVGEQLLGPREHVGGRDLDQQDVDHPPDERLEPEVEIVEHARRQQPAPRFLGIGSGARPLAGMPMASSMRAVRSSVGGLERDVAGREPHVLVAGLVVPAGFVARRAPRTGRGRGARAWCRRCSRRRTAADRETVA